MKIVVMLVLVISFLFGAVDINTATKGELSSLKGIGAVKADKIIEYRATHCFENVNALAKVKGISEKTIAKNRENLTASECKK